MAIDTGIFIPKPCTPWISPSVDHQDIIKAIVFLLSCLVLGRRCSGPRPYLLDRVVSKMVDQSGPSTNSMMMNGPGCCRLSAVRPGCEHDSSDISVLTEIFLDLDLNLIRNFFLPINDSRVPGLRKPNNDVQPSIVEAEAKGHVEETLERTNVFFNSFSFTPPCDGLSCRGVLVHLEDVVARRHV